MKILLSYFLLMLVLSFAAADGAVYIPEIGAHQPILTIEKNVNPENSMVVYTKTDDQCRFIRDPENDRSVFFDVYWLMNGEKYKRVHKLIKRQIRRSLEVEESVSFPTDRFVVNLNDLKKVETDIAEPQLVVVAELKDGQCTVEGRIKLGPSDDHRQIRVDTMYTEGRKFPPSVSSITLTGADLKTGEPLSRTYRAD